VVISSQQPANRNIPYMWLYRKVM